MIQPQSLSRTATSRQEDTPDQRVTITLTEALDALSAVLEALDVPHAATVGDQETRNAILLERVGHTVVMLKSILHDEHRTPDPAWSVEYLRARLAKHPAAGYKTWEQRMAELDAAKAQDGAW